VAFELINEPFGSAATNATTANLNRVYVEAIRRIRLTNPTRTIFVAPGDYNGMDELENVMLPDNESNVIVTVHCYQPFYFTHQGAEWTGPDTTTTNVVFPGPPATPITLKPPATNAWVVSWFNDYNTLPAEYNPSSTRAFIFKMQRMRQWADYFGRPVYVGEFGCYAKFTPKQSRLNYYQAVRKVMDEQGLGWATWDWKSGFNYINRLTYQPDPPGMKDAMFPPIQLRATRQGTIESDAAAGKNFVVERRLTLSPTNGWQPVATQTLASPKFLYQDPGTNQNKTGFYRVKWQY
jgi:endoglucanase